jgi:hypothetical protein
MRRLFALAADSVFGVVAAARAFFAGFFFLTPRIVGGARDRLTVFDYDAPLHARAKPSRVV